VSNKFLNDVRKAMTGPQDDQAALQFKTFATYDLSSLNNDPQAGAVWNAIIKKIENHDPALGPIEGHVERYPGGEIKGLSFENPQQEAAYAESLNKTMLQGYTKAEAVALDETPQNAQYRERGVLQLEYSDLYPPTGLL
jgi:hypothetical protein